MKDTKPQLYPLKFNPILKNKVWGGNKLHTLLNKAVGEKIGESWEISGVGDDVSTVQNGPLKGKKLDWLVKNYRAQLVGERVYQQFGNTFPLLFKFIDAAEDLSVQVHPGDLLAKQRHNSFGKTEMWYILQADANAQLIVGFTKGADQESYLEALSEKRIAGILNSITVERGDAFIINTGTVHAIGAGVLLAEIQQTSDITYRIYDWDRPGIDGQMRELHTDLALDAINFSALTEKTQYSPKNNFSVEIGGSQYFSVNKFELTQTLVRNLESISSFTVYMCLEGEAMMESNDFSEIIETGETVLIPSCLKEIKINTKAASFLEVYIP